ncbi:putative 3-octaprenyl-4-hydroxybenzoate carboxy-lyase [Aspergillus bertholletiae]|uniref:Ferulic acid decarboxylase 1 n=1 Tax=Aspergillus bertholletiae TaxID=1226010 RepID=A0A5N7B8A9_9EURO|nr:putative 3-octaprenyl-4-hydroxybenzoate carboxy-lyase [Aspergillus bertholletiae]
MILNSELILKQRWWASLSTRFFHRQTTWNSRPDLDFRSFIDCLREDGDLADIHIEVDPYLEVGAIARRVSELDAKAPLFHNVKGSRQGLWRIFANAASLRKSRSERFGRVARGLGLPPGSTWKDINAKILAAKKAPVTPPNIVPSGPCKENKIFGDDINLVKLPVPKLHETDGGRYLQTYGMHICQAPDGSWTNWSIARAMVHDKNRLVGLVLPPQHIYQIRELWRKEGREAPWALALGVPTAAIIAAGMPIPDETSEGEYVSALTGSAIDMVKCETNDLLVPANSEIILEGAMSITESDKAYEGPFGEYLGYCTQDEPRLCPTFRVDAITYRHNAILPISVPGKITDESHTLTALTAPELLHLCLENNLPFKDAVHPLETYANWCVFQVDGDMLRRMKTTPGELCRKVGEIVFNNKTSFLTSRVLLVGDDINIYEFGDVMWAYTTRCRPGVDDYIFEDIPGLPLMPFMPPPPCRGGKVVSNCLLESEYSTGPDWINNDFAHAYPEDVKTKVLSNWEEMGLN